MRNARKRNERNKKKRKENKGRKHLFVFHIEIVPLNFCLPLGKAWKERRRNGKKEGRNGKKE